MNKRRYSTSMQILYVVLIIIGVLVIAYGGISWWVYSDVQSICEQALQKYPGETDKVDALILYLKSESPGYNERNRVVWALGELRSEKALPLLESLLKNKRYDKYEVQKAIKKIKGEIPNPYFWK